MSRVQLSGPTSLEAPLWQVESREVVYDAAPHVTVRKERIRLPDGHLITDYHTVQLRDFVVVVATTPDDEAVMLRGYKHGAGRTCLTFPGGLIEPGEDPEFAARRELTEETGFSCDALQTLGSYVVNGNQRCAIGHMFYATNARRVGGPTASDLERADPVLVRFADLPAQAGFDGFNLLPHAAALGLAFMWRARSAVPSSTLALSDKLD